METQEGAHKIFLNLTANNTDIRKNPGSQSKKLNGGGCHVAQAQETDCGVEVPSYKLPARAGITLEKNVIVSRISTTVVALYNLA